MSITRTLDGKLSATLAMISIVGWLVVAIVDQYRLNIFPDAATVALVLGLAITAFKFYSEDKAASKNPEIQKAQVEASVEIFLDKLAKYRAMEEKNIYDEPPDFAKLIHDYIDELMKPKEPEDTDNESVSRLHE